MPPSPETLSPDQACAEAMLDHRMGRLTEAEAQYRAILAKAPDHADTLHLLGVVAAQTGRYDQAEELIRRAVGVNPQPSFLGNLGSTLKKRGRLDAALACYQEALTLNPSHPESHYSMAGLLLDLGRAEEAVPSYRQAIAGKPGVAVWHYDLATVLMGLGRPEEAAECYGKAIALRGDYVEAHANLGNILHQLGRLEESAHSFERAIAVNPTHAFVHGNLAQVLRDLGRLEEAVTAYRRALTIDPALIETRNDLGVVLSRLGRHDEAIACHQDVLTAAPNHVSALNNLGMALKAVGRIDDAMACYRKALAANPDFVEARNNLGLAFGSRFEFEDAAACYREVLAVAPDFVPAHNNLGLALADLGRPEEAAASYRRALAINPDDISALGNLGIVSAQLGRTAEAVWCYDRALEIDPSSAAMRVNRAVANLAAGNLAQGWADMESRWDAGALSPRPMPMPRWAGEDIAGRVILLHAEQGLGDIIQFSRYVPMVADLGATVILEVPESLRSLLARSWPRVTVRPEGEVSPAADVHCPLMSLPLRFDTALETIPASIPYLSPPPVAAAIWRKRVEPHRGFKVGLVWAGAPRPSDEGAHSTDRRRSMPLARFAPLAAIPHATFFSLQKGDAAAQANGPECPFPLVDFTAELDDFDATAALASNLDLVITVDTAVAHLAGALGKPVWVLSRFDACWRWLRDRTDSPWYPTARVFRQPRPGDWNAVVVQVADELRRLTK